MCQLNIKLSLAHLFGPEWWVKMLLVAPFAPLRTTRLLLLVALLWDNAAREPSPKGCCCNQSLPFFLQLTSCKGPTAQQTAETRAYQQAKGVPLLRTSADSQLSSDDWISLITFYLFPSCASALVQSRTRHDRGPTDASWGELKSLPTYWT